MRASAQRREELGGGGGGGGGRSGVSKPAHLPLSLPSLRRRHSDRHRYRPIAPKPDPSPSLPPSPQCPAHPGGLFSCPARANPRLGVSRASRFLVLRKEQGVGVGQRRQLTGGSESRRSAQRAHRAAPNRREENKEPGVELRGGTSCGPPPPDQRRGEDTR
ncbi:uncharacterized protein V6R79_001379 [Siganus canaliculatus]